MKRCPTPYKQAFLNMRGALLVVGRRHAQAKRGKGKYTPVEPYHCDCGSIHLAAANRVRMYLK